MEADVQEIERILRDNETVWHGLRSIGAGKFAGVIDFFFTSAIVVTDRQTVEIGYLDRFCYKTRAQALAALEAWAAARAALQAAGKPDAEIEAAEPAGWHRHPKSGRRRENGDPETEYVYA